MYIYTYINNYDIIIIIQQVISLVRFINSNQMHTTHQFISSYWNTDTEKKLLSVIKVTREFSKNNSVFTCNSTRTNFVNYYRDFIIFWSKI